MFNKFLQFASVNRRQIAKYLVVGTTAFIIDITTLIFLKEKIGLHPVWSVALNQIIVVNYIFFLNKYWSFQSQGQTHKQLIRFLILVILNYFISVVWMWLWTEMK